jgi:hypothetical protein
MSPMKTRKITDESAGIKSKNITPFLTTYRFKSGRI